MYKMGEVLCDRCRCVITEAEWEIVELTRRMDFCDIKCRILYFRGRKYYQKKLAYMREQGVPCE